MPTDREQTDGVTISAEMRAEMRQNIGELWASFGAYLDAGFSPEQAIQLMCAFASRSVAPQVVSPELSEALTKMTTLYDRMLADE